MDMLGAQSISPQSAVAPFSFPSLSNGSLIETPTQLGRLQVTQQSQQLIRETQAQLQNELNGMHELGLLPWQTRMNGEGELDLLPWQTGINRGELPLLPWQTGMNREGIFTWTGMNEWDTERMGSEMERRNNEEFREEEERKLEEEIERMEERERRDEELEREEEEREMEEERQREEEFERIDKFTQWMLLLSGFKFLTLQDASILYIDEMLEEMLDGLNVQDTPRLLVLLAAADPIVKFVLQNNPREARLRQACSLAADPGTGTQLLNRYYYDSEADECRQFTYTGSGGNDNRFMKEDQCTIRCRPNSEEAKQSIRRVIRFLRGFELVDFCLQAYGDPLTASYRALVQLWLTKTSADTFTK